MEKYGQYCPAAKAVEILGDRWTLLIVRNLLYGVSRFNDLERGLPGISRGLLADRLRRLERAGILEPLVGPTGRKHGYCLTQAGRELGPILDGLTRWGAQWAFDAPDPSDLDPVLLLWWMRDRVYRERLPARRVVVEFLFHEARPARYWLVLSPSDVSVCLTHPGFEVDMWVTAELAAYLQVWLGRIPFEQAAAERKVQLDGHPDLTRVFPNWFALSPTAEIVQAAMRQRTQDTGGE